MKITEKDLRQIIREELTRMHVTEGTLYTGWESLSTAEKVDVLYGIMEHWAQEGEFSGYSPDWVEPDTKDTGDTADTGAK